MNLSQIQLVSYHVLQVEFRVNRGFKSNLPPQFPIGDLNIATTCSRFPDPEQTSVWTAGIKLKFAPNSSVNTPYFFELEIAGMLFVVQALNDDKFKAVIKSEGSRLLYGVSRELVRELSAKGPSSQIVLPTLDFTPEGDSKALPESNASLPGRLVPDSRSGRTARRKA